jgi:hypothetical protein
MSSNSFVRVAGIAGILSAVCMVGFMFTVDQTTMTPNSPLFPVLLWVNVLTGIVLTVGLYQFYRQASPTLGLVATAISLLGYLLFAIVSFAWNPENILVSIGDTLIYIVGVSCLVGLATARARCHAFCPSSVFSRDSPAWRAMFCGLAREWKRPIQIIRWPALRAFFT